MGWYSDQSIYHYLQYGATADKIKRESRNFSKSNNRPDKQFPRPTQESEKKFGPFQRVVPRNNPPPLLTKEAGYEPVPSKKPQKNLGYLLSKKKD